jgi:uncharacterized protein YjcR
MNLKEFCEANGLKYDTVKSWKSRGKLKEKLAEKGLTFEEETPPPKESTGSPEPKKAPVENKSVAPQISEEKKASLLKAKGMGWLIK